MALESKVYRALEDIVGPENISQEAAILDTYAFQMGTKAVPTRLWMARPEAVLLPGSVEEVQAIVKTCNRYEVRFKAICTGFSTAARRETEIATTSRIVKILAFFISVPFQKIANIPTTHTVHNNTHS